jgi:hypothetical protein
VSADDLTFASALIVGGEVHHIHYARCEPCTWRSHPGGPHDWAGPEDVAHAANTGQPDPTGQRCACDCFDQPATDEPPFGDDESLTDQPCVVCGEAGACGYDAEGLPMIHATWIEDDE